MKDYMGGRQSENYRKFQSMCMSIFRDLRMEANLFINFFMLVAESQIN